jgi:S1-C subfamily serine protease
MISFASSNSNIYDQAAEVVEQATEREALDAYSAVVTSVAERLIPSVASIRITRSVRGQPAGGAGSGIVITPDGFLLTSAHVIANSRAGVISFADGREAELEVVGADPLSDLAVVRVGVSGLFPVPLGDADRLRVGQLVVAVGNPFGFSGSVTAGVVSALGRSFPTREGAIVRYVENVIQTDAALNPGNSGGALADSQARLVGVNTAVAGVGLGLAVPINSATSRIISALMREGRVRRAYLGVAVGHRPLPPRLAKSLGQKAGVAVIEVVDGGPAASAGIRPGDLVLTVDGSIVESAGDLQRVMVSETIGRPLVLRIVRNGEVVTTTATPVELRG